MMIWSTLLVYLHFASTAAVDGSAKDKNAVIADWSQGETSWRQASVQGDSDLWSQPNACDTTVLQSSAPLTLLFGISTLWSDIRQRREASKQTEQPFEVHVLGAAYPFEGRADWSLLASRRPKNINKVRIVLVLGTPWQADNVPVLKTQETNADETSFLQESVTTECSDEECKVSQVEDHSGTLDETTSLLMQYHRKRRNSRVIANGVRPAAAKWENSSMWCKDGSLQAAEDSKFVKADVCRDHGNGLEVVCIEEYYQDVRSKLPSPDVVAMFSPGFPQLARRSWDDVLRNLLLADTPIMVCDLLGAEEIEDIFQQDSKEDAVAPGHPWKVDDESMEDGMTHMAMQAYGARSVGSYRNPFPIFNTRLGRSVIAKNAVLQMFSGRESNAAPFVMPSSEEAERRRRIVENTDFAEAFEQDKANEVEVRRSLLIPTSTAYERAMTQLYRPTFRGVLSRSLLAHRPYLARFRKLGLSREGKTDAASENLLQAWDVEDWIFVLRNLNGATQHVF